MIQDRSDPCAYFQGFEKTTAGEPSKRQVWLARERELGRLDLQSWQFLKEEALPYLTTRDPKRGWSQLISILNQARGYNFLVDEGCKNVCFVPKPKTAGIETPDVAAHDGSVKVLCEIKSIQCSDNEADRRAKGGVRSSGARLEDGFFNKLRSDLKKAKGQMSSFDADAETRHIAFFVLEFDDALGEYKREYFQQIDDFLENDRVEDLEVVFYNPRTAFGSSEILRHARVVNEIAG